MVEEGREIKATWLWFITHTTEQEINTVIGKYQWILNIPITYDCTCGNQQCCIKTEYFTMANERDLFVLYQNVLSGTCSSPDVVNSSSALPAMSNNSCTSAAVANSESSVVLNMSVLQESEKICPGLRCSLSRNANTVGFYAAHVFAAKNLKSCFATAEKLHDKIPNHITYKKGLRIIDLLLEHKRYEILDSVVLTRGWIFGLGRVYRAKFHNFTANSIQNALELVIKKNDTQACQILLIALMSRCYLTFSSSAFKRVVEKIVQHNALDCLHILIPYLRKFPAVKKYITTDMILKCLRRNEAMKVLIQNQILPLSPCFRTAVQEDKVDFVRWVVEQYPLYFEQVEEGHPSLLLQATINDSPAMVETLLQASKQIRSLRCRRVPKLADDLGLALQLAQALKMSRCADVLSNFEPFVIVDVHRQQSLSSVVLNTESKKYSKVELIKRLIEAGYDINTCASDHGSGVPPLYDAVVNCDIELIKVLLSRGASLFNERDLSLLGFPPRLLAECIYRNVDICTERGSVLNDILDSKKREKLLYLVLRCAHTIPQTDREKLRQLCLQEDFYGHTRVTMFLNSPRRLTILSRNSLRKHYAHEIHWSLSNATLPPKVRDFISLERQLEPYLALPLTFSKAYDDLVDKRFDPDFDDEI